METQNKKMQYIYNGKKIVVDRLDQIWISESDVVQKYSFEPSILGHFLALYKSYAIIEKNIFETENAIFPEDGNKSMELLDSLEEKGYQLNCKYIELLTKYSVFSPHRVTPNFIEYNGFTIKVEPFLKKKQDEGGFYSEEFYYVVRMSNELESTFHYGISQNPVEAWLEALIPNYSSIEIGIIQQENIMIDKITAQELKTRLDNLTDYKFKVTNVRLEKSL